MPKSPKKVSKLKKKQEANKKLQEQQQQYDDINDQKKGNEKKGNDKKGVWVCVKCRNLNFSFRTVCNRCQLPKEQGGTILNSQPTLNTHNNNSNSSGYISNGTIPQIQFMNNEEIYLNDLNIDQLLTNNINERSNSEEKEYYK